MILWESPILANINHTGASSLATYHFKQLFIQGNFTELNQLEQLLCRKGSREKPAMINLHVQLTD